METECFFYVQICDLLYYKKESAFKKCNLLLKPNSGCRDTHIVIVS